MTENEARETTTTKRLPVIYEATTGAIVERSLREAAMEYARRVGLNPWLSHICLYFGRPWVTIDGHYYLFRRRYPLGCIVTRALDFNEREHALLEKEIHAWRADVYESAGGKLLATGYGYARGGEESLARKSAVEPQWPWRMAEKRAEEDALRKAVPLEDLDESHPLA